MPGPHGWCAVRHTVCIAAMGCACEDAAVVLVAMWFIAGFRASVPEPYPENTLLTEGAGSSSMAAQVHAMTFYRQI